MSKYKKCIDQWDDIFSKGESKPPKKKESGNKKFDNGLAWLTKDANSILDFGCGNGTVLFLCNLYGTNFHIGIDLSSEAIKSSNARSKLVGKGEFQFICGGIEALKDIPDESMDSAILSNIVDNLYLDDAISLLDEIKRILKKDGKLLVKLNPYITAEQILELGIKTISGNLLDDGMILWNNTNEEWKDILGARYSIYSYEEIYYEAYDQYNRMFLLTKED